MRYIAAVFLAVFSSAPLWAQSPSPTPMPNASGYVRPNAAQRGRDFFQSTFGVVSLLKVVSGAGVSTAANYPEEWGPHWDGFGKRVASNLGITAISGVTRYGLDEALKLDSHFYRSKDRSIKARIKNGFISPFTALRTNGRRTIGVPNIVGTFTGNVIATGAWYPERYGWKDGMTNGAISLGTSILFDLFREFVKK